MPIPEALTVITAALTVAKNIYTATTGLHDWIDGVKHIDKTVKDLGDEVISLRETLQSTESVLSSDVVRQAACLDDEESRELWFSLFATLKDCRTTISGLNLVLAPLKTAAMSAILRKFKLDLRDTEISTIRQQVTFHSRRLQMSVQMVHLRVSCLGPTLVSAGIDSKMDKLQALIQTQVDLLVELAKNSSSLPHETVNHNNFDIYAKALDRSALKLLSSSASMYSGSQFDGSVADDDNLQQAIQEWVDGVSLPVFGDMEHISTRNPQLDMARTSLTSPPLPTQLLMANRELVTQPGGNLHLSTYPSLPSQRDRRAEFLLAKGFNVEPLDFKPDTALVTIFLWHLKRGEEPGEDMEGAIELLTEMSTDLSSVRVPRDSECANWVKGKPLLHVACIAEWTRVVAAILRNGNYGTPPNSDFISPLFHVASTGNINIVEQLIAAGADVTSKTPRQDGKTALHIAAEKGHATVVKILLNHGADVSVVTQHPMSEYVGEYHTPLILAIQENHKKVIEILLDAGASVDESPPPSKVKPLHHACRKASLIAIKVLVARHADVNAKEKGNLTPVTLAAKLGAERSLLGTALEKEHERARARRYKDIVDVLLEAGAECDRSTTAAIKKLEKRLC